MIVCRGSSSSLLVQLGMGSEITVNKRGLKVETSNADEGSRMIELTALCVDPPVYCSSLKQGKF